MLEKPKRVLRILKIRVRELFTRREVISTPRACHKGRQPLIECMQRDFRIIYFSLFIFFYLFHLSLSCAPLFPSAKLKQKVWKCSNKGVCLDYNLHWFWLIKNEFLSLNLLLFYFILLLLVYLVSWPFFFISEKIFESTIFLAFHFCSKIGMLFYK